MLVNNTIESSRRPGIPGPHRPDLKWYKDALDGKSDVGHVHTKKEIEDFEHNHDGRYYRKDLNELDVILSGNGTPNFNQGDDGDYYIDELNEDMYVKEGDAWRLLIHLKGDPGIDGYTPIKGVDYWTKEDQNKIVSEVESTIKDKRDELDQHAEELKEEISEDLTALTDSKVKELEDATADLIEKVTSLELQKRVVELEEENQKQQEELDILNSDYKEGKAEGETAVVSDGLPKSKISVKGNGNSYQETTEGYNLCNAPYTINNKLTVTATRDDYYVALDYYAELEAGKTYTISFETNGIIGASSGTDTIQVFWLKDKAYDNFFQMNTFNQTFTPSVSGKYYIRCDVNANAKTYNFWNFMVYEGTENKPYEPYTNGVATPNTNHKQDIEVIDGVNINILEVDETNWELTDNGIKNLKWNAGVSLGKEINLKANVTYYFNFVLLSRPTSGTSFTSYIDGAVADSLGMINIEVPARFGIGQLATKEYTPTKDEVYTIKMWGNENKDIFEFQYWITTVPNAPYLKRGHIGLVQKNKNIFDIDNWGYGVLNNDGSITSSTVIRLSPFIELKNGMYFSFEELIGNCFPRFGFYDENKNFISRTLISQNSQVVHNTAKYIRVSVEYLNENKLIKPMLEYGSVATTYEEPKKIVHSIDLAGNSLAKVGEIKDLLNIGLDGKVSITKKIIMDYFKNYTFALNNATNGNIFFSSTKLRVGKDEILSNIFRYTDELWQKTQKNDVITREPTNAYLFIRTDKYSTKEEFNNAMNELNSYFYGPLAEPQTINLPSIEPIELFEGTNVFELVTNLGTTLAVTYKVSNKKKILNLEERISALESAVIGG